MRFRCGLCNDMIWRTRKGLRIHLKDHIRNNFANSSLEKKSQDRHSPRNKIKQKWWIVQ